MTSRGLLAKDGWCHQSTQHGNIRSGVRWALPDKCRSHLQADQMPPWAFRAFLGQLVRKHGGQSLEGSEGGESARSLGVKG